MEQKKTGNKKTLTQKTFSGTLYLLSSGAIQLVLKIGVLAILARLVSPNDFGIMGIALVIVEFSKLFSQMGVGPCIVQRPKLDDRLLSVAFTLSLLLGISFAAVLVAAAPVMEIFFRMPGLSDVLRVVALIFLINAFTVTAVALLQRNMKFKSIAAIEISSYAFGYGAVGILLAYQGLGVWALAGASLAQAAVAAILYVLYQPFSKKLSINTRSFKELLYFGFGFTLAKLGNFFALQGDAVVVGRMLGAAPLGIYGRAHNFMVMPASFFGTALDRTLFPAMAKVQDNRAQLAKAFLTGTGLIAMVSIPVSVLFVLLAPEIILVLLGPAWSGAIDPFRILACGLLFRMSYKMSDSLARATGAVYRRAWRQIIYAALVFVGAYIGHFWGLPGVAAAVGFAVVANFFLMSQLAIKLTGITWISLFQAHRNGIALGLFTALLGLILVTLFRYWQFPHWATLLGTTGLMACSIAVVLRFRSQLFIRADQQLLIDQLILKRFKKPLIRAA